MSLRLLYRYTYQNTSCKMNITDKTSWGKRDTFSFLSYKTKSQKFPGHPVCLMYPCSAEMY